MTAIRRPNGRSSLVIRQRSTDQLDMAQDLDLAQHAENVRARADFKVDEFQICQQELARLDTDIPDLCETPRMQE